MTFLIVALEKNTKYSVCITFKNHYGPSKVLAQQRFFTTFYVISTNILLVSFWNWKVNEISCEIASA